MTASDADTTRYRLKFVPDALKEWQELDGSIKEPLRKALKKRLEHPMFQVLGCMANCRAATRLNFVSKDTVWSTWLKMMYWSFWYWQ